MEGTSQIISNKKIKLFNKFFNEFLESYLKAKSQEIRTFKIKKSIVLKTFFDETLAVIDNFLACDPGSLKGISLLRDAKVEYSEVVLEWNHLHNLLWIVQDKVSSEHLEASKKGLANPYVKTSLLGNLIQEMSGDIQNSLANIDLSKVNPIELLSTLTKPGGSKVVGGVDFSEIIERSTAALRTKIENKTVDIEELKSTANDISSKLSGLSALQSSQPAQSVQPEVD
jgi:hypothetical protein